jgi:hypothetical protein
MEINLLDLVVTEETKDKMSLKKAGENNPLYGKLIVRILNS